MELGNDDNEAPSNPNNSNNNTVADDTSGSDVDDAEELQVQLSRRMVSRQLEASEAQEHDNSAMAMQATTQPAAEFEFDEDNNADALAAADDDDDDKNAMDEEEDAPVLEAFSMDQAGARKWLDSIVLEDETVEEAASSAAAPTAVRTKNELSENQLPAPEPLTKLKVPDKAELSPAGAITSMVDGMIVVQCPPNSPALEVGNVLCVDRDHPVGTIFEVFGPVSEPLYLIRYNASELDPKIVRPGVQLQFARAPTTKFVQPAALHVPGSDASNLYDEEVGDHEREFSDDEEEARFKAARRRNKRNKNNATHTSSSSSSSSSDASSRPSSRGRGGGRGRGRGGRGGGRGRGRGRGGFQHGDQRHYAAQRQYAPQQPPFHNGMPPHQQYQQYQQYQQQQQQQQYRGYPQQPPQYHQQQPYLQPHPQQQHQQHYGAPPQFGHGMPPPPPYYQQQQQQYYHHQQQPQYRQQQQQPSQQQQYWRPPMPPPS